MQPSFRTAQETGIKALSSLKDIIEERFEDATDAEEDGKYERALSLCNEIIRLDERHAGAWKMRTRLLMALDRLEVAFENARAAAKLFPSSPTHRLMQGRIHVKNRRWREAAATYRAILKDAPPHLQRDPRIDGF